MITRILALVLTVAFITGCRRHEPEPLAIYAIDPQIAALEAKPMYQFNEAEVDRYLRHLHRTEPDMSKRMVHLARKNIGQPYELYLLGEAPFETIDAQPIYCLDKSDCVVFAEHVLAMSLTDNWRDFMTMLQRIRYRDGHISVVTRNHYTEADWNRNNSWLVRDITSDLGGEGVIPFSQKVNRAKLFRDRYKLEESIEVQTIQESFIPYEMIPQIKSQLRDGDIVNFVTGRGESFWVGHVGMIGIGEDGSVNLIHSTQPTVREEPIEAYIARNEKDAAEKDAAGKARFRGFKFLRPTEDPLGNLAQIDGPGAPRVTVPEQSTTTWEQFLQSFDLGG
jgi:hypothetical protein